MDNSFENARNQFIVSWGDMGSKWGVNKTMSRIHALLMISQKPLSTEDVMKELAISRGNANMNLRGLVDWGLARRVAIKGERKEFFQSEPDVWNMFCRIARERKRREIEPVIDTLEACLRIEDKGKEAALFKSKLKELLDFVRTIDFVLGKVAQQERSKIMPQLIKMLR